MPTTSGSTELGDVPTLSTSARANGTGAELGDAIAQLEIPKLELDKFIIEGVGVDDLKKGPGTTQVRLFPASRSVRVTSRKVKPTEWTTAGGHHASEGKSKSRLRSISRRNLP